MLLTNKKNIVDTVNMPSVYSKEFIDTARELETLIGHEFESKGYLYKALTHSSYSNEMRSRNKTVYCNERLEFLGDSVLSIIVTSYIFSVLSTFPEGELSKIRAYAVCEDALYQYAKRIGLGRFLALGRGEEKTDGRNRKSILADATEALIAAVYLDSRCELDMVENLVMQIALPRIEEICETIRSGVSKNYKGALQQLIQNSKGDRLEYEEAGESGPDHDKIFTVKVKLNSNVIGIGVGRTKQEAEQAAAKEGLVLFGEKV